MKTVLGTDPKGGDMNKGFTLVEVLVAVIILAVGILTVSQMTVLGLKTTTVVKQQRESKEILAKGLEVLRLLNIDDPLLVANCPDSSWLDSLTGAYQASPANIVGQTIGQTTYDVYWNVVDSFPQANLITIRMFLTKNNNRMITADYVKWR
jgi:prepilin-type N-terminal cleavage/methylation domain-containing protein